MAKRAKKAVIESDAGDAPRASAKRLVVAVTCRCGKVFEVAPSRIKHGRGRTCSRACQYAKASTGITQHQFTCGFCKKDFERPFKEHELLVHGHSFCSRKCHYAARGTGLVGRIVLRPYNLPPKATNDCKKCSKAFMPRVRKQQYCSDRCRYVARLERASGANNFFYVDGLGHTRKPSYRGPEWKWIRSQVYKRDKWRCRRCDVHCEKGNIQCHHIRPYRFSRNNAQRNLITLCKSCHKAVHERPENNAKFIRLDVAA